MGLPLPVARFVAAGQMQEPRPAQPDSSCTVTRHCPAKNTCLGLRPSRQTDGEAHPARPQRFNNLWNAVSVLPSLPGPKPCSCLSFFIFCGQEILALLYMNISARNILDILTFKFYHIRQHWNTWKLLKYLLD